MCFSCDLSLKIFKPNVSSMGEAKTELWCDDSKENNQQITLCLVYVRFIVQTWRLWRTITLCSCKTLWVQRKQLFPRKMRANLDLFVQAKCAFSLWPLCGVLRTAIRSGQLSVPSATSQLLKQWGLLSTPSQHAAAPQPLLWTRACYSLNERLL